MSNFLQGQGKQGVVRRRTEVRRTSNPAVLSASGWLTQIQPS